MPWVGTRVFPKTDSATVVKDDVSLDDLTRGNDLPAVAQTLPSDVIIMGNISPTGARFSGSPKDVEAEVNDLLERMAPHPHFLLSTGCDLPQKTPLENIRAFVRTGRLYQAKSWGRVA